MNRYEWLYMQRRDASQGFEFWIKNLVYILALFFGKTNEAGQKLGFHAFWTLVSV